LTIAEICVVTSTVPLARASATSGLRDVYVLFFFKCERDTGLSAIHARQNLDSGNGYHNVVGTGEVHTTAKPMTPAWDVRQQPNSKFFQRNLHNGEDAARS
jgi:hypothetical protein